MALGLCEEAIETIPPAEHLLDQIYVRAKSTASVIGATKDNGTASANNWGSNFDIEKVLDVYECKHTEMNLRAFDKYYLPKRLHYSATTQVESVHLLMDVNRKTTSRPVEGCSNE